MSALILTMEVAWIPNFPAGESFYKKQHLHLFWVFTFCSILFETTLCGTKFFFYQKSKVFWSHFRFEFIDFFYIIFSGKSWTGWFSLGFFPTNILTKRVWHELYKKKTRFCRFSYFTTQATHYRFPFLM